MNSTTNKGKDFRAQVYEVLKRVPAGKVITYGQIAEMIGKPGAARAVGNALNKNRDPINVPCHRVVNSQGRLAKNFGMGGSAIQKERLEKEGVKVEGDYVNKDHML